MEATRSAQRIILRACPVRNRFSRWLRRFTQAWGSQHNTAGGARMLHKRSAWKFPHLPIIQVAVSTAATVVAQAQQHTDSDPHIAPSTTPPHTSTVENPNVLLHLLVNRPPNAIERRSTPSPAALSFRQRQRRQTQHAQQCCQRHTLHHADNTHLRRASFFSSLTRIGFGDRLASGQSAQRFAWYPIRTLLAPHWYCLLLQTHRPHKCDPSNPIHPMVEWGGSLWIYISSWTLEYGSVTDMGTLSHQSTWRIFTEFRFRSESGHVHPSKGVKYW